MNTPPNTAVSTPGNDETRRQRVARLLDRLHTLRREFTAVAAEGREKMATNDVRGCAAAVETKRRLIKEFVAVTREATQAGQE